MRKITLAILALLFSSPNYALDESEVLQFFSHYRALADNFDIALSDSYADDALLRVVQTSPDGLERKMNLTGQQYKSAMSSVMKYAKQRGDISEYSEIKASVSEERGVITAVRYSTVKCFTDSDFWMVIEKKLMVY